MAKNPTEAQDEDNAQIVEFRFGPQTGTLVSIAQELEKKSKSSVEYMEKSRPLLFTVANTSLTTI